MNLEQLDKTIRQIMRKKNTPGLALTVVQNDDVIYANTALK